MEALHACGRRFIDEYGQFAHEFRFEIHEHSLWNITQINDERVASDEHAIILLH